MTNAPGLREESGFTEEGVGEGRGKLEIDNKAPQEIYSDFLFLFLKF